MHTLHALLMIVLFAASAHAGTISYSDPAGDDFGPGKYKYPIDAVYKRGSFDLRGVEIRDRGSVVEFRVALNQRIEDPWDSRSWQPKGNGFSVQLIQIYLDRDHKPGSGFTKTLPGVNARFKPADAWDRVVFISPQGAGQVKSQVKLQAGKMARAVVVPIKVKIRGRKIIATVKKSALGGAPKASWGVQVVVGSSDGYAGGKSLFSRKVNEYAGKHLFGGGSNHNCDPHVMDILAGQGQGQASEILAQKKALAYTCGAGGQAVKWATLPMLRKK